MRDNIEVFFEKHIDYVDKMLIAELYEAAALELSDGDIHQVATVLNAIGINPLDHMNVVPVFFLSGADSVDTWRIPGGITRIDSEAFSRSSIQYLQLPASVKSIESFSFDRARALKSLEFDSNSLCRYIGYKAFRECGLPKLVLPNSITAIFQDAFIDSAIQEIVLPQSLRELRSGTFRYCAALEKINIPKSVVSINSHVFEGCVSLFEITYEGTMEEWSHIGFSAEWYDAVLQRIICTDGVINV